MKKIALCLHDLRVSEGENIKETINSFRETFKFAPITLHLVLDKDLNENESLFGYLKQEVKFKRLEIVFHGISHQCHSGTGKYLAWYHKYQAEFLGNSFNASLNKLRYKDLNESLQTVTGICPPCWIASASGWEFIESLFPYYIEKLWSFHAKNKRYFSLPISLGSKNISELFFLRIQASLISAIVNIFNHKRLRLVVHTIDLSNPDTMTFFRNKYLSFISKGFFPVLQKDLIN